MNYDMDDVFQALAHPIRREILDFVVENPGCLSGEISAQFDVSRITIVKHIKTLEKANLLVIENEGRTRLHYFNPLPIQAIYDRWTNDYSRFFSSKLAAFKASIEKEESENPDEKTA